MKTRMRVAVTALAAAGVLAGCTQTTTGTVAQTTEPGPPLTTTTTAPDIPTALPTIPGIPGLPDLNIPGLPGSSDVPEVPAPPNATTMACSEYQDLDDATRLAVIKAILAEQSGAAIDEPWIAQIMADAMCPILPNQPVRDAVVGPAG